MDVSWDEVDAEDEEVLGGHVRAEGEVEERVPRGVAGTTVCVEVVESEEDEDEDDEMAGE